MVPYVRGIRWQTSPGTKCTRLFVCTMDKPVRHQTKNNSHTNILINQCCNRIVYWNPVSNIQFGHNLEVVADVLDEYEYNILENPNLSCHDVSTCDLYYAPYNKPITSTFIQDYMKRSHNFANTMHDASIKYQNA